MFKTLQSLSYRFRALISAWSGVDWQIALSSSAATRKYPDHHDSLGHIMELNSYPVSSLDPLRILNPSQYGADWIFRRNLSFNGLSWPGPEFCEQQPYCTSPDSEPLRELELTVYRQNDKANRGFFRPGATFVPVIISAHDEHTDGSSCKTNTKPADVLAYVKKNLPTAANVNAYSFVIQPGDKKCLAQYENARAMGTGGHYGRYLAQFAKLSGGTSESICQNDFGKALANLSQNIRQKISSVTLAQVPWDNSLKIVSQPAVSGLAWTVQGRSVTFNQPLPPGTTLSISYLYSPAK